MRLSLRLIGLAFLPIVGLVPLTATAGPSPGPHGPSGAGGGVTQVQYLEIEPAPPPAVVDDDDDDVGIQGDAVTRCAAQFRSFEPETGYYTTYAGDRVLCPYLQ
jgi:hypothetical protein